jgi:transcription elongation factor Elf1
MGILPEEIHRYFAEVLLRNQKIITCPYCGQNSWWNIDKRKKEENFFLDCPVCMEHIDIRKLPDWSKDVGVI